MIQLKVLSNVTALAALAFAGCSPDTPARALANASETQIGDSRIGVFETGIKKLRDRSNDEAERWTMKDRMEAHGVPGAAVAIIQDGKVVLLKGYGVQSANADTPVDAQTVFSVGSVSKVVNAALILRLVQSGILDIDQEVNSYLKSWKVPEGEYTKHSKVTLRRLLSHTSGFSQHGFPDFQPDEKLPTTIQTLNGEAPAKHDAVRLMFEPGSKMVYSGGGVTVAQLIVEDVTGLSYPEAAQKFVFAPLGMKRSSFANPLPEEHSNIARAHDKAGKARALPRGYEAMPEMAASGLWTSAEDMALFILAILGDDTFLSEPLRTEMLTRVPRSWHGLGPRLNGADEKSVFHHGGANDSYQTWIEGHPVQQNGFVVLTNGQGGRQLAYELRVAAEEAYDWTINFPDDFDEPSF